MSNLGDCVFCNSGFVYYPTEKICKPYCGKSQIDNLNSICQPCVGDQCNQFTKFTLVPVNQNLYRIVPSRPLGNPNFDYSKAFKVNVQGA
jgi:hypothetical protein